MKTLLLAALFSTALYAESLLELKSGYFLFVDSKMSDIYTDGGADLQLSATLPIREILHLYLSVEGLERSGKSLEANQSTTLWEVPLSAGLRPIFSISEQIKYYFTLGPRYFFVFVNTDSSFVDKHMRSNGLGGFANSGFFFNINRHLTLDLFAEYSYAKLSFTPKTPNVFGETAQVGGLAFGGGLAYRF